MNTIHALTHFADGYAFLAYVLLFVGVVLEGELVMILAGILAQIGALSMPMVLGISFGAALVKTISWYQLGYLLNKKYSENKFLKYLERRVLYLFPYFKEKPFWSIFVSKFIYGINHFTLILAGFLKINFKTYFKAELYSSILWVLVMTGLGYFFSQTALGFSKDIHRFSLIILLFIIGFVFLEKIIAFLFELFEESKAE
jgi:membrane protein DedA with SNARE-associated domain